MDLINDFVEDFGISHVFSVAPESEWPKIYPNLDPTKVTLHRILTGYLDDSAVRRIDTLASRVRNRPIDVGYRAGTVRPWWGRQNLWKLQLGSALREQMRYLDLVLDCRVGADTFLLGDAWYRFLLSCKYTVSAEGGASVLDYDGKIEARCRAYLEVHPNAEFSEIEALCFPGLDGQLDLRALSPRHLEACATRTCQILLEGQFNGILEPGKHYIELRRDLSNLRQVLDAVKSDHLRDQITERAYRDIVVSGRYSHRGFVQFLLATALGVSEVARARESSWSIRESVLRAWFRTLDDISWLKVILASCAKRVLLSILPASLTAQLRKLRRDWEARQRS
jgi:hypothetical protein